MKRLKRQKYTIEEIARKSWKEKVEGSTRWEDLPMSGKKTFISAARYIIRIWKQEEKRYRGDSHDHNT